MDGFENKNPYAILGLEQGHLASQDDIKKARLPRPRAAPRAGCAAHASPGNPRSSCADARPRPAPSPQAYKKMVLVKHPDKRRGEPNAAAEFDELQKAYELLTDEQARGAYDDLIK
jgi:hypothetical protein